MSTNQLASFDHIEAHTPLSAQYERPSSRIGPQKALTTTSRGLLSPSDPVYEKVQAVPGAVLQAGMATCWKARAVEASVLASRAILVV